MTTYYFETREFGVSDKGIHFLRSRFNYKTLEFGQVDKITIENGKELNNWVAILIIGILLVTFSVYYSLTLFNVIGDGAVNRVYIEELLVPVIPLMLGGYCLYSSTRNGLILRIRTSQNASEKFPLKELQKEDKVEALQEFLRAKVKFDGSGTIKGANADFPRIT